MKISSRAQNKTIKWRWKVNKIEMCVFCSFCIANRSIPAETNSFLRFALATLITSAFFQHPIQLYRFLSSPFLLLWAIHFFLCSPNEATTTNSGYFCFISGILNANSEKPLSLVIAHTTAQTAISIKSVYDEGIFYYCATGMLILKPLAVVFPFRVCVV